MDACIKFIPIVTRNQSIRMETDSIYKIQRDNRRLSILTAEGEFYYYEKLERIEQHLGNNFYSCLKGCLINLDKVKSMKDQTVVFENGQEYNLGRSNYIKTRQVYSAYIKNLFDNANK